MSSKIKIVTIAFASFVFLAFSLFVWSARTISSSLAAAAGGFVPGVNAIIWTILTVLVSTIAGVVVGLVIEKRTGRYKGARYMTPCVFMVLVALVALVAALSVDHPPKAICRKYLDIGDAPASLSDLKFWWTDYPGDEPFVLRFHIDPSEFTKLLEAHQFVDKSDRYLIDDATKEFFSWPRSGIYFSLPTKPLVKMVEYEGKTDWGGPKIIRVLTTQDGDEVVVCGDN